MKYILSLCNADWKVFSIIFAFSFVFTCIIQSYFLSNHMKYKGKCEKYNVTYRTVGKCAFVVAGILTIMAYAGHKVVSKTTGFAMIDDIRNESTENYEPRSHRRSRKEYRSENIRSDDSKYENSKYENSKYNDSKYESDKGETYETENKINRDRGDREISYPSYHDRSRGGY